MNGPPRTPRPTVFIHVMKTGGTSVGRMLGSAYEPARIYPPRHDAEAKVKVRRLLGLSEAERAEIDFFSVHMPAWVAEVAAPEHARTTVLREPVGRTVSHLRHIARAADSVSLEEILADEEFRARLADYQTQLFSETEAHHRAEQERRRAAWERLLRSESAAAPAGPAAAPASPVGLPAGMFTAIEAPRACTRTDLEAAIRRLDGFEVVGVSERLGDFRRMVSERLGFDGRELEWLNRAPTDDHDISPRLLAEIRKLTELDRELYETVLDRAAIPPTEVGR